MVLPFKLTRVSFWPFHRQKSLMFANTVVFIDSSEELRLFLLEFRFPPNMGYIHFMVNISYIEQLWNIFATINCLCNVHDKILKS